MTDPYVPPAQLSKADVSSLYSQRRYAEIEAARQSGQLDTPLGVQPAETEINNRLRSGGQLSKADVSSLYSQRRYAEIEAARQSGQLDTLYGSTPTTN